MIDSMKSKIDLLRLDIPFIVKEIIEKQYKLQPKFKKYGTQGMQYLLNDAKYNLEYLFSSLEADSKLLFLQYNRWANIFSFRAIKLR